MNETIELPVKHEDPLKLVLQCVGIPMPTHGVDADEIERLMIAANCPLADDVVEYKHLMSDDVYYREMHVKAGTMIVGARHIKESLSIILKGSVLQYHEGSVTRVDAPYTFLAQPGVRRVGFVVEDLIWANVFRREPGQTMNEIVDLHCTFTEEFKDYERRALMFKSETPITEGN